MVTDGDYYADPDDSIIAEISKFREELSKRFHGDIRALSEEMRRQAAASGIPSVTRPPKPSKLMPPDDCRPVDRNDE